MERENLNMERKNLKIKHSTISSSYEDGGLKDVDVFAKVISLQCSWKTPPHFCSSNIIYFGQKEPIKVQILRLSSVGSKFGKFLMSFFKAQVSSSSNLASFFSVMA